MIEIAENLNLRPFCKKKIPNLIYPHASICGLHHTFNISRNDEIIAMNLLPKRQVNASTRASISVAINDDYLWWEKWLRIHQEVSHERRW